MNLHRLPILTIYYLHKLGGAQCLSSQRFFWMNFFFKKTFLKKSLFNFFFKKVDIEQLEFAILKGI